MNKQHDDRNDLDANVRGNAADALGDATAQPEVVPALLAALRDPDANVPGNAARALERLAGQAISRTFIDLPQQLAASLELPGLGSPNWDKPFDSIFQALDAVAPGPVV